MKLRLAVLAFLAVVVSACASRGVRAPQAFTDPDMNFDKIRVVAVLPVFPENVEDQIFSGALGMQLESALVTRQSQWKLIGAREVLQIINKNDLGRGYKNLQADMNVPASGMGQIAYSPGTNEFVRNLKRATGADAFIVGTYNFSQPVFGGVVGQILSSVLPPGTCVKVSLLYANGTSAENWWSAIIKRKRINDQVLQEMAASVAANIGKGTLLQL